MFDHRHYVAILKGKRAEFPAMAKLKSRDHITPLLEAVPSAKIPIPNRMNDFWNLDRPYFIDFRFADTEEFDSAEEHPIRVCFNRVEELAHKAIPVTSTGQTEAYRSAVASIVDDQGQGFAIRLGLDDFEDEEQPEQSIDLLLGPIGAPKNKVDLIVDLGSVCGQPEAQLLQIVRASLASIPSIDQWRSLTLAAGAFPKGVSEMVRDIWNMTPRKDWRCWRSLVTGKNRPSRLPTYSDYGIRHPDPPYEGFAPPLAQLRYCCAEEFITWKGWKADDYGYEQFIEICKNLVGRPEYRGQQFSAGDDEIYRKAIGSDSKTGNPEAWTRIGTNHHLETVMDQIASLPVP